MDGALSAAKEAWIDDALFFAEGAWIDDADQVVRRSCSVPGMAMIIAIRHDSVPALR
jgi:hypothetical protein